MELKIKNALGYCRAINSQINKPYKHGDSVQFQLKGGHSLTITEKEMQEMNKLFKFEPKVVKYNLMTKLENIIIYCVVIFAVITFAITMNKIVIWLMSC